MNPKNEQKVMTLHNAWLRMSGAALFVASATFLGGAGCQSSSSGEELTRTTRSAVVPQKTYAKVRIGYDHTCGLATDGTMDCFGSNSNGEGTSLFGTFLDVSPAASVSCAIRASDKRAVCWGYTGGLGPTPTKKFKSLSNAGNYACGILDADSTLSCWGDYYAPTAAPPGTFKSVAAGWGHACAIDSAGGAQCWGDSGYGATTPSAPTPSSDVYKRVVSGYGFSCGLTVGGSIYCWGRLDTGLPAVTAAGTKYVDFAASDDTLCALDEAGVATCWGLLAFTGTTGGNKSIAVGQYYACVVTESGALDCWGDGETGSVVIDDAVTQVARGGGNTCVLKADKSLVCYGDNYYGVNDVPGSGYKAVAVGSSFACAIQANDQLTCWGDGESGQMDWPSGTFSKLAANNQQACAIGKVDQKLSCWGASTTPPPGTFKAVALGSSHGCALNLQGAVTCWGGDDYYNQTVAPSGTFTSLTADWDTTCAIAADKSLVCWGEFEETRPGPYKAVALREWDICLLDEAGKLSCEYRGEGYGNYKVPVGSFKSIVAHCGVRSDDALVCWANTARNFTVIRVTVSPEPVFSLNQYQPINQKLTLTGGTAPYTCKSSSTYATPGLTVTSDCTLKGSPIPSIGAWSFPVDVTDANGYKDTFSIDVTVSDLSYELSYTSGSGQSAYVGEAYAKPLVVQATGEGVPSGVWVDFAGPNLTFDPPSALTDETGSAKVTVTPTGSAGPRKVWATLGGVGAPVVFELTAKSYASILTTDASATSVKQGERVEISANVDSKGTATGKLHFFVDGDLYCVKALADEAASCKLLMTEAGEHQLSAQYLGDGQHDAATSEAITVTVAEVSGYVPPSGSGQGGALNQGGSSSGSGGSSSASGGSSSASGGSSSASGGSSSGEAGSSNDHGSGSDSGGDSSGCSYAPQGVSSQSIVMLFGGALLAAALRRRRWAN